MQGNTYERTYAIELKREPLIVFVINIASALNGVRENDLICFHVIQNSSKAVLRLMKGDMLSDM